jgi:predicted DNA-binding transcriptional regulator AlpA
LIAARSNEAHPPAKSTNGFRTFGGTAVETSIGGDDRILTSEEVEEETKLSKTSQWRGRKAGWFPPLLELSPGRRGNTLGQIRRWKAERLAAADHPGRHKGHMRP